MSQNTVIENPYSIEFIEKSRTLDATLNQKAEKTSSTENVQKLCGWHPCTKMCFTCIHFKEVIESIHMHGTKEIFIINERLSCESNSVIYVIDCLKCNMQYLGSSVDKMKLRANKWRSDILQGVEDEKTKKVVRHFNATPHNISRDLRSIAVEKVFGTKDVLEIKETMYIKKFDMIKNGLN